MSEPVITPAPSIEENFSNNVEEQPITNTEELAGDIVKRTKTALKDYLVAELGEEHEEKIDHIIKHLELIIIGMGGVFMGAGTLAYIEKDKIGEAFSGLKEKIRDA